MFSNYLWPKGGKWEVVYIVEIWNPTLEVHNVMFSVGKLFLFFFLFVVHRFF